MFAPRPVGWPGIAALAAGFLLFAVTVLVARSRRVADAGEAGAARSRRSTLGIAIQALGMFVVGFGPQRILLDPLPPRAWVEAAVVLMLMLGAIGLFAWAQRTMGRNWSIVARTRADHQLVQEGPFRYVRHPIYTAIFLLMPATAIALGHSRQLILGVPLYALGTAIRVSVEEGMLRTMFGADYDTYARRVKRFLPGVF